jgi:3-hydroxyisobutyrate dehydrogenase-like beta-hydroxyacid dehydrogenase
MANLGYIGLGAMGGRMANRLLDKGHTSPATTARARRRSG